METHEIISQILTDLGPLVDRLEAVTAPAAGMWGLQFEDDAIQCELAADGKRLYLTMDLGALHDARREDVLQSLLAFNSLWAETGSVRMALDQPGGQVLQVCDILTQDLEVTKLAQVVEALLAKAQSWKALLAGAETTPPSSVENREVPGMGAIRV